MEVRKLGQAGNLLEDREDFFELDDQTYTLPRKIPSRIAVELMEKMERGDVDLTTWLLTEVLGEDAYNALRDSESVDVAELAWVFEQLSERTLGDLEKSQGKSRNGTRRSAGS